MINHLLIPDLVGLLSGLPLVHGGADEPAGLAGLVEILLEKINSLIESGAAFLLFPGIRALASNVHPMIVHFPIALLSAFFLLELTGVAFRRPKLREAASWMLYLGAIGAIGAAAAGLVAAANVPHGETVHEVMEWHERLMLTVSGLALVLAVWRAASAGRFASTMALGLHLFLATVMIALMGLGADLGGLMVYQHGVGVASLQQQAESTQHAHSAPRRAQAADADEMNGATPARLIEHAR